MDILLSFALLVVGRPLANEVAGSNGLRWHDKVSERTNVYFLYRFVPLFFSIFVSVPRVLAPELCFGEERGKNRKNNNNRVQMSA